MSPVLCMFTAVLLITCVNYPSSATVTLTSSADSVCPGDTVMFICVTDTGKLLWEVININNQHLFSNPGQINMNVTEDIFTLVLLNVTGTNNSVYWSTATAHHVPLNYSERNISCFDSDGRPPKTLNIKIAPPPSPPLSLCASLRPGSPVTISWVAPQDTPLCVHSYTVTVRNSCNSSQVMVYNTTDNRSLLSITDLTSDGEYSVTVAGRDGAGRLGQESEELRISLKCAYRNIDCTDQNEPIRPGYVAAVCSTIVIMIVLCGYLVVCAIIVTSRKFELEIESLAEDPISSTDHNIKAQCRHRCSSSCEESNQ